MVKIKLKVRYCTACGQKAVALDGEGTPCTNCDDGEFGAWDGETKAARVSKHVADEYRENFPDQLA